MFKQKGKIKTPKDPYKHHIDYLSACLKYLGSIALLLLTSTCAKVEELEGGPKDTVPPQLVSTYPLQESIRFKDKKLQLTFDKDIEIQDIYNRLIITPKLARLENKPSYIYKVKDRTLEIILQVLLEEDTTYTFNFKDVIHDTRESTPAENPTLTFSTGDYVDAMYATGQVKYLMTDQPVGDALVALYKLTDTDTPPHILNSTPDYFTKADQNGTFKLEHIKKDRYRLCAGFSKESKLILDPSKDLYGFLETTLDLSEPVDNIQLHIVEADVSEFKIQGSQPQGPYFEINFSKPVSQYTLELARQSKRFKDAQILSHLIENGLTIRMYNTLALLEEDIIETKLIAHDAMGNLIQQNINVRFRNRPAKKEAFKYNISPATGEKIDSKIFKVDIACNKPVKSVQPDGISLIVDKTNTIKLSSTEIVLHPQKDHIIIQKAIPLAGKLTSADNKFTEKEEETLSVELNIAKGTFVSVEKEANESQSIIYGIKKPQECGIIKGRIKSEAPGFVIQLLNMNYEVIQEVRNKKYYEFKDIPLGNYKLRVLVLQEKEGKWNFGNINKLEPPDRVIFYPHELTIVANWEIDYIDFEI